MIFKVGATCEESGMEINAKEKNNDGRETPGKQCKRTTADTSLGLQIPENNTQAYRTK